MKQDRKVDAFLTLKTSEVARFFGVTPRQVNNWERAGCPKLKRGRFDLKAVHEWWLANVHDGGTDQGDHRGVKQEYWKWKAEGERLKVEQKAGKLVDAEGVKRVAFEEGRRVRDAILNVPARISAQLAVMRDQFEVEQYLADELKQSLRTLSSEQPADE